MIIDPHPTYREHIHHIKMGNVTGATTTPTLTPAPAKGSGILNIIGQYLNNQSQQNIAASNAQTAQAQLNATVAQNKLLAQQANKPANTNTIMYIVVGSVGLVIIGLVIFLIVDSKKAV